ncbi:18028_t:CDS:2 [Rhizophagus irregularis]|nr:18028_t:CDS:2 [Rhizophagus irregularis]
MSKLVSNVQKPTEEDNTLQALITCIISRCVLQYDGEYNNVKLWSTSALAKRQRKEFKPKLPVCYKKAITDYPREIGKIDCFENVLLIITVPAEFSDKVKAIMRNNNIVIDDDIRYQEILDDDKWIIEIDVETMESIFERVKKFST